MYGHFLDCSLLVAVYVMGTQASNKIFGDNKGSVEEHSCSSSNASSHFGVEAVFAPCGLASYCANSGISFSLFCMFIATKRRKHAGLNKTGHKQN